MRREKTEYDRKLDKACWIAFIVSTLICAASVVVSLIRGGVI